MKSKKLHYEAIDRRDIAGIAENVHRKDVGKRRNDWAEDMIFQLETGFNRQ